jgi:hypothetical protein
VRLSTGVNRIESSRNLSVIAFDDKAGRSQVISFFNLLDQLFSSRPFAAVGMLRSALSSRARVLFGASTVVTGAFATWCAADPIRWLDAQGQILPGLEYPRCVPLQKGANTVGYG